VVASWPRSHIRSAPVADCDPTGGAALDPVSLVDSLMIDMVALGSMEVVRLTSFLVTFSLAACQLGVAPSFEVRLPSPGEGISPLDVVVEDHAGVVSGVTSAAPADWTEGVSRSNRPGRVIVSWLGGVCDTRATLSIASEGGALTIRETTETTETTGGGCLLAGIGRSVAIDLDREVAPETIRLVGDDGT
jgi:hypothetical protein